MFFNRTNDKKIKIGSEKIANIKIFKAEFIEGKWKNIKELPFCSDAYSTEHPVLSEDGKKLYLYLEELHQNIVSISNLFSKNYFGQI